MRRFISFWHAAVAVARQKHIWRSSTTQSSNELRCLPTTINWPVSTLIGRCRETGYV